MFSRKFILYCIAIIIIGALSMFLYRNRVPRQVFTWNFNVVSVDESTQAPQTEVKLLVNEKEYLLGTHEGSCVDMTTTGWRLVADEVAGAVCWFAGGGTELGVFVEGENLVVKKGILDEGTAEESGTRGNFETVLTLE